MSFEIFCISTVQLKYPVSRVDKTDIRFLKASGFDLLFIFPGLIAQRKNQRMPSLSSFMRSSRNVYGMFVLHDQEKPTES